MFESSKKNKLESGVIIGIFILVITLIVYYICNALDLGSLSIVIALIFSVASAWGSYYYSDKIVLASCKARPATKEEDQKLVNILDALMVTSGLPCKPRLYVVEDAQPNAFATGRNPQNAVICVTTGLLEKLDYYELEGVIAHEMSHIKNYDIRLNCIVSVMVGFIVMLSDTVSRLLFWSSFDSDRDNDNKANGFLMIIGLVCLILSPICGLTSYSSFLLTSVNGVPIIYLLIKSTVCFISVTDTFSVIVMFLCSTWPLSVITIAIKLFSLSGTTSTLLILFSFDELPSTTDV